MGFTIVGDAAIVSGSMNPSRAAAVFTGGDTDDAFAVDNWATDRKGTDTVGSISAWIMTGDITSTGAILSMNDANVVEFLDFKLAAGKIAAACTDATVAKWATATTNVVIEAHKWYHVALVQDGIHVKIYLNGVQQALTDTVTTANGYWVDQLAGVDKGWIGASSIGGAGAVGEEFVGGISDVKYWSVALTEAQVQADYDGKANVTGTAANLTDWWTMKDLVDVQKAANNMVAVSDVYLTPTYNEFISKVRKFGAVVADAAGFACDAERATVLFINAA
jgi:hypothetical protein